jgi:phosphotransferase system HPr (HPr) family protein
MTRGETRICNKLGMHLRSAGSFVRLASSFESQILVGVPGTSPVDGKSILGLATLGAAEGATLVITAEGPDERDAVSQLIELVERGFDEN